MFLAQTSPVRWAKGKQSVASALGNFFKFWAYASTIIGAIVAGTVYTAPGNVEKLLLRVHQTNM